MSLLWTIVAGVVPALAGGAALAAFSPPPRGLHDWVWLFAAGWLLMLLLIGASLPLLPGSPRMSFAWLAPALVLVAVVLGGLALRRWRLLGSPANGRFSRNGQAVVPRTRWLPLLTLVLGLHFALLLHQALLMPSFPWDAWTVWLLRARSWLEADAFLPLLGLQDWLASDSAALPTLAPAYPDAIPGVAVWFGSAAGGWGPAVHLAWPLAWLSGVLALWSGLLRAGVGGREAELTTLVWASLPMLSAHAALAGYADLWMALMVMLAALSALRLEQAPREPASWLVLLMAILLLPWIKLEGWIWSGTLLAALVFACLPPRGRWIVATLAATAGVAVLLMLLAWPLSLDLPLLGELRIGEGQLQIGPIHAELKPQDVLVELRWTLFVLPHWHLFWLLLPVALWLGWRRMRAGTSGDRVGLGLGVASLLGLLFLILVFGFSQHAQWLQNLTSINRLLMHWLPLPLVLAAWCWRQAGDGRPASSLSAST